MSLEWLSSNDITIDDASFDILSNHEREKMENCLFCKKIRIENIDEITLDYGKDCFFMTDILIRKLRKKGYSEEHIKKLLFLSYNEYLSVKNNTYKFNKNSQLFIDEVHKALCDANVYEAIGMNNQYVLEAQKQGLIHLVADDKTKNVWWGGNKING